MAYHLSKPKIVRRISTGLTREEAAKLKLVERYVRGFCGEVSRAEVVRYLIRNWSVT